MSGINHKIINFLFALSIFCDTIGAIICYMFATLPDKIDRFIVDPSFTDVYRKFHRTITHWLVFYVGLFIIFYYYVFSVNKPSILNYVIFYILLTYLLHILCDALTGSIPIINPFKKVNILKKIFKVNASYYQERNASDRSKVSYKAWAGFYETGGIYEMLIVSLLSLFLIIIMLLKMYHNRLDNFLESLRVWWYFLIQII